MGAFCVLILCARTCQRDFSDRLLEGKGQFRPILFLISHLNVNIPFSCFPWNIDFNIKGTRPHFAFAAFWGLSVARSFIRFDKNYLGASTSRFLLYLRFGCRFLFFLHVPRGWWSCSIGPCPQPLLHLPGCITLLEAHDRCSRPLPQFCIIPH